MGKESGGMSVNAKRKDDVRDATMVSIGAGHNARHDEELLVRKN